MGDAIFKHIAPSRFLTYLAVGLVGTGGHYFVLIILVQLFGSSPVFASASGFVAGAAINYFANYHFTFRSRKCHRTTSVQFFTVAIIGLGLNTLAMVLLTTATSIHYLLAQVLATGVVVCLTYIGNRFWTFREAENGRTT